MIASASYLLNRHIVYVSSLSMPVIACAILCIHILVICKAVGISVKINPVSVSVRLNYQRLTVRVSVNSSCFICIGKLFFCKACRICCSFRRRLSAFLGISACISCSRICISCICCTCISVSCICCRIVSCCVCACRVFIFCISGRCYCSRSRLLKESTALFTDARASSFFTEASIE